MGFSFSSFSSSTIENLKSQVNIIDVIGRVVPLKKAGANFTSVCPFHNEKTPSFVVSEQKQIFTCFGCGAKGDVIEFVMKYYNLEFGEAIEKIADEYGIKIQRNSYDDKRDIYYEINRKAAAFFYKAFTEKTNKGYLYMKNRGIDDRVLKKFGIGYADEKWDSLYNYFRGMGTDIDILLELGLISESKGKYYDKFRNRVIFPIINTSGKVIGFGGRAIGDDKPKYLNSPESKIFQKKSNLYGLNISRQEVGKVGYAILVEGYMDTISLHQNGIKNVVASLGTALTENQSKLLKRYTNEVILSYDADEAGRNAALRGLEILNKENCKVKVLHVSDGKDPDDYIKKNGKKAFLNLVEKALPLTDYKLEALKEQFDCNKNEEKIDFMKKAISVLQDLSPIEQDIYIKKLSKELKISEGAIRMEILGKDSNESHHFIPKQKQNDIDSFKVSVLEKHIIKLMLNNDRFINEVNSISDILESDFSKKILHLINAEYNNGDFIDSKKIMDQLEPEESAMLQHIIEDILIGGKVDEVFEQCIKTYNYEKLLHEEQELITMLSLADEENNKDKIKELTERLIKVQKQRNCSSRGNI